MEDLVNGTEDYRDRLGLYLNWSGISPHYFAGKGLFSNGHINKLLRKELHIGVDRLLVILEHFPELSPAWLLTGEGVMVRSAGAPVAANVALEKSNTANKQKVANEIHAFLIPLVELVGRAQSLGLNVRFLIEAGVETEVSTIQTTDTLKIVEVSVWERVSY